MTHTTNANPRHIEIQVRHHVAEGMGLTHADARQLALQLLAAPTEEIYKDDGRSRLTRHTIDGTPWVVKRFHAPGLKTRLKQLVHLSPAWREWDGALQLHQARARVLEPLALVTGRMSDQCREAIILPFGGTALSHWIASDTSPDQWSAEHRHQREMMAEQIGEQLGHLLSHGVVNRDHKAANLLVDDACAHGDQPPLMIDPAGLRNYKDRSQALRALRLLHKTGSPVRVRCIGKRVGMGPDIAGQPGIGMQLPGAARGVQCIKDREFAETLFQQLTSRRDARWTSANHGYLYR